MSPPIRDGSGSSIDKVRLGNGSDITEIRNGNGDVLYKDIIFISSYQSRDLGTNGNDTLSETFGGAILKNATQGELDWYNPRSGRNTSVSMELRVNGSFIQVGSRQLSNVNNSFGTETFSFSAVDADAARINVPDNKMSPKQFRVRS